VVTHSADRPCGQRSPERRRRERAAVLRQCTQEVVSWVPCEAFPFDRAPRLDAAQDASCRT